MAEAFLAHRLEEIGVGAKVHSAGLLSAGLPASHDGVLVLADMGFDTSAHRSRRLAAPLLADADLVLGMAREHVQEAVALDPECWPRCFTIKELVRRAEDAGPRSPDQPFDEWLAKLHAGRGRPELMGGSSDDDVADPIGGSAEIYRRTATERHDLVLRLVELGWGAR